MALFLASDDSRACTGQNFVVDAGHSIGGNSIHMLHLQNSHFTMTISPQLGGADSMRWTLWYMGCDILYPAKISPDRQVNVDNPAIKGGSYPLVPYSNRVCDAPLYMGKYPPYIARISDC